MITGERLLDTHSYDALTTQLAYRRDRRHTVFAWCSSIFVGAIGGLVAFADKPEVLNYPKIAVIFATVFILTVFTCWWMKHHWDVEKVIQTQVDAMNMHFAIYTPAPPYWIDWAQTLAVLGLALVALAATLLSPAGISLIQAIGRALR